MSTWCDAASSRTASMDSGDNRSRSTPAAARPPRTSRSGWSALSSSSRHVTTARLRVLAMRRASSTTRSSVASSAHCRSSMTSSVGRARSSSSSTGSTSWTGAPRPTTSANGPAASAARSASGPSGRGVKRRSHHPAQTRTPASSAACSTSAALADAGFPGQEDQSASRGRGLDQSGPQTGPRILPLQQGRAAHHRLMLTPIRRVVQRAPPGARPRRRAGAGT